MAKYNAELSVTIVGAYDDIKNLEPQLQKLARKYHGRSTGAGTILSTMERDISFVFKHSRSVEAFASRCKGFHGVSEVLVESL